MNAIKTPAEPSSGRERSRVLTSLRMLGIALTLLRGLTTLKIRKDLSLMLNLRKSTILYLLE